jgi:DNA-binding NtrC family response regulator
MKQSLLVLDDEPDILRLMERIVKTSTPYNIQTTNNSLEFISIMNNQKFDLVITDLKMPGMNGYDILNHIQENKLEVLVIVCTAYGNQETAMDLLAKGAFEYLYKPFRKEHIMISIERAMKYQRFRRESFKYRSLFSERPFDRARDVFMKEYINCMNLKYDHDINEISTLSGIDKKIIEKTLTDN